MTRLVLLLLRLLPFLGLVFVLTAVTRSLRGGEMDEVSLLLIVLGFFLLITLFLKLEKANLAYYLHLTVLAALFLGNCVVLYLLARNHPVQWDVTRTARYSLSSQTRQILQNLQRPVQVTVTATRNEPYASYLRRFEAESDKFSYTIENPYQTLKLGSGPQQQNRPNEVRVRSGEQEKVFAFGDTVELEVIERQIEQEMVNAILTVIQDRRHRLYFVTGHGEKTLENLVDAEMASRSIYMMAASLSEMGMGILPLDLKTAGAVPEDCSCLVLAGPRLPYTEPELRLIESYLDRGGSLLALIDPLDPSSSRMVRVPRLRVMLQKYGIDVSGDIILDYDSYDASKSYFAPVIRKFNPVHPVTKHLRGMGEQLPMTYATSVRLVDRNREDKNTMELLYSSEQCLELSLGAFVRFMERLREGEVSKPADYDWQPLSLAVAAEPPAASGGRPPRLVVVGDSDFISNAQLGDLQLVLAHSALTWLVRQSNAVEIPPRNVESTPLILTRPQRNFISIFSVVIIPFSVFFGGLTYTTLRRRRR